MNMKKNVTAALTALALSAVVLPTLVLAGGGGSTTATSSTTIAGVVASNPNFSTLLQAVQAAGLAETLSGRGPFTVFAPTNAAFAKLPPAQLQALLNDPAQLRRILTYHVVAGRVTSTQVVGLRSATTVEGSSVAIAVSAGTVRINNARVTSVDIPASNGIIHVIDTVLLPQ